ncbi:hypothetical protein PAXRUDRAFT_159133 [Paxillus rubicundulus Ve08.2h10]|uniref:Uncharacterized protein n=1 Tax=Paxillus rubicundulus Ve08.2h10 TaxID=930991 RepID=A0A0D0D906_9AGAM|nr:hypothetical protein PAXRUDRAFT_159133 [Paxillus rubicundulus Ve08.2h10]
MYAGPPGHRAHVPYYSHHQYQYHPPPALAPPPSHQLPPTLPQPGNNMTPSEFLSPGITTKHKVTLKTFCQNSIISSFNVDKLTLLGYVAGNYIIE